MPLENLSRVQKFKTPLSSLSTGGLVRIPRKHGLWLSPNVGEYNLIYKSSINQAFELWSPGILGYLDHPHMQTMAIPWLSTEVAGHGTSLLTAQVCSGSCPRMVAICRDPNLCIPDIKMKMRTTVKLVEWCGMCLICPSSWDESPGRHRLSTSRLETEGAPVNVQNYIETFVHCKSTPTSTPVVTCGTSRLKGRMNES